MTVRWLLPGLAAFLVLIGVTAYLGIENNASPTVRVEQQNAARIARGRTAYAERCASCHGANLEGQADWRTRRPNGRLPAPPHDDSGHTWHHPDDVLLAITKHGLVPPYAPAGYPSDMPAFGDLLSDEDIRAVLAYIQSRWSPEVLALRREMLKPRN